jgi:hypothetical protein
MHPFIYLCSIVAHVAHTTPSERDIPVLCCFYIAIYYIKQEDISLGRSIIIMLYIYNIIIVYHFAFGTRLARLAAISFSRRSLSISVIGTGAISVSG